MKAVGDQLPDLLEAQQKQDRYRGCLLGGAVGDALGAPVEFMSHAEIIRKFGANGIDEYVPAYGKLGAITDDTQMTLFTAEGLLRVQVSASAPDVNAATGAIAQAYQRWFHTQGQSHPLQEPCLDGWLLEHRELHSRRGPGITCLTGLKSMRHVTDLAKNDSKGCGGVMRVAPIGMYFASLALAESRDRPRLLTQAFDLACKAAAITHGHPTGQLASGAFAAIIMELLLGEPLSGAINAVLPLLAAKPRHEETTEAIQAACRLAAEMPIDIDALAQLGEGWVAEEALAIALYCALSTEDFRSGVVLAVNHNGDSDSTGSMAGQLLGALHGVQVIPGAWLEPLELRGVIETMADDLLKFRDTGLNKSQSDKVHVPHSSEFPNV